MSSIGVYIIAALSGVPTGDILNIADAMPFLSSPRMDDVPGDQSNEPTHLLLPAAFETSLEDKSKAVDCAMQASEVNPEHGQELTSRHIEGSVPYQNCASQLV